MSQQSELTAAIERVLQAYWAPMDCVQLFDIPEIRAHAESANRVSDYLGKLWRKNLVVRFPAPNIPDSKIRWQYQWKSSALHIPGSIECTPQASTDKPTVLTTERGSVVTLDLEPMLEPLQITVVVRSKLAV